ncbi:MULTISPECIES: hypothetical protein, partial [Bacillus cereus group]|uniref:hypothetical protein n=1 Tax=Bacillus cereus group TaxID=86661 RepID=UPI0005B3A008
MLKKRLILIGQSDIVGKASCQFDAIQYENETYLIVWHPNYKEFIIFNETKNRISHTDLHQSV